MADVAILASQVQATPNGYRIPGGQEILLKSIRVSYDGTGAGGSFVPVLQLVAPGQSGTVVSEYPLSSTLAAGASADVTWFPGVTPPAATSTAAGLIYAWTSSLSASILTATTHTFDFNSGATYFQQSAGGPFSLDSDGVNVGLGSTLAGTYQVMTGVVANDGAGHRVANSYSVPVSMDVNGSGWFLARPQFGPFDVNGALRSGNPDSHWCPAQTSPWVVKAGGSGAGPLVINATNNTGETLGMTAFAYALYLSSSVAGV